MADLIPLIRLPHGHRFSYGEDNARYLLRPGVEFRRPWLQIPGGPQFVWPVGTENFRYQSNASLGVHRFIGDDEIEVNVIYRDEPRIEMSGTFPGKNGPVFMRNLLQILEAKTPQAGKILFLPFIFPRIQYVAAENWNFDHDGNDRTRSIGYQITFLRVGAGRKIELPGPEEPQDPGQPPPSQPPKYFIVRDGHRTMRAIAKAKLGNANKWNRIYTLNKVKIDAHFKKNNIARHKYPTTKLPLGWKLRYA